MLQQSITAEHCIMLHSGRLFDLEHPEASEFTVDDIAHGLAHLCRYVGQCDGFYSVAEHSVLVSQVVPHAKLAALFHDATEAFIGDVSGPLKRLLPDYRVIERKVVQAIFDRLGIEWPVPPEVKRADYSVMAAEQLALMPAGTNEWLHEMGVEPAAVEIRRLDPRKAKALFLERYAELLRAG
jgi:hypothetical protein